jgi:predicted Zn-dependent protease
VTGRTEDLVEHLSRRYGACWELYEKHSQWSESAETPSARSETIAQEDGIAVRYRDRQSMRFAAARRPDELLRLTDALGGIEASLEPWPALPAGEYPEPAEAGPAPPAEALFSALGQTLARESRGDVRLARLTLRQGLVVDRLRNGAGFAGGRPRPSATAEAVVIGARNDRRLSAHLSFFAGERSPDAIDRAARQLVDRARFPLDGSPPPFSRGELLLDPSVGAALLAAIAPLFVGSAYATLLSRRYLDRLGRFLSSATTIIDDPTVDYPFDGEGTPTRRTVVAESGGFRSRLHDARSARECGEPPTGHSDRPSYRVPPRAGIGRLRWESAAPTPGEKLLASVRRGLYAAALLSPIRVDFESDRLECDLTGIVVEAGRGRRPVSATTVSCRLSDLLKRIVALGNDRQWFPLPAPVGSPTMLIERATFS